VADGAPAAAEAVDAAPAEAPAGVAAVEEGEDQEALEFKDDAEEDDGDDKKKGKKKGKKARATVEIEYDEELGVYITRKKRKASRAGDVLGEVEE